LKKISPARAGSAHRRRRGVIVAGRATGW